jgi:hypothetical protein
MEGKVWSFELELPGVEEMAVGVETGGKVWSPAMVDEVEVAAFV